MCLEAIYKTWDVRTPAVIKPSRVFWKVFATSRWGRLRSCYYPSHNALKPQGINRVRINYYVHAISPALCRDGCDDYLLGYHAYLHRQDAVDLASVLTNRRLRHSYHRRKHYVVRPVTLYGVVAYGWEVSAVGYHPERRVRVAVGRCVEIMGDDNL